ncbi:hypothetical protein N752_07125 [Desulforamulus aquiferis]|nr:hypothetical protein N752_07125 [Desulforamulus aquiferis]
MTQYETVIGIEVHVELKTNTKIFCHSTTEFGEILTPMFVLCVWDFLVHCPF